MDKSKRVGYLIGYGAVLFAICLLCAGAFFGFCEFIIWANGYK